MELIQEAKDLGVKQWNWGGGGEPLMRRQTMLAVMEKIKNLGMQGDLTTNGTLLRPEDIKFLVEIGWDNIFISIDGPDAETNDAVRLPMGTFQRVINTIEAFIRCKQSLHKELPRIIFHCVINNINFTRLVDMVEFALTYKMSGALFDFIGRLTEHCDPLLLDIKRNATVLMAQIQKAREIADYHGLWNNLSSVCSIVEANSAVSPHTPVPPRTAEISVERDEAFGWLKFPCYQPWYHIFVSTSGNISSCCLMMPGYDNIKEKSLRDVWLGGSLAQVRSDFMRGIIPEGCKVCNATLSWETEEIRRYLKEML
jgi:MoaA/NifB/PqqE/SkfB family radical SAM enzyme